VRGASPCLTLEKSIGARRVPRGHRLRRPRTTLPGSIQSALVSRLRPAFAFSGKLSPDEWADRLQTSVRPRRARSFEAALARYRAAKLACGPHATTNGRFGQRRRATADKPVNAKLPPGRGLTEALGMSSEARLLRGTQLRCWVSEGSSVCGPSSSAIQAPPNTRAGERQSEGLCEHRAGCYALPAPVDLLRGKTTRRRRLASRK
jgi:hypothetical protein